MLMEETWKDIYFEEKGVVYDYRGLYMVSDMGSVKSLGNDRTRKEKKLKATKNKHGYLRVRLSKNGKKLNFYVHRLVAHMFVDGHFDGAQVNHIDENNCVDNLEWVTSIENCNHGTRNERINKKDRSPLIDRFDMDGKVLIDVKYQWQYVEMGFDGSSIFKCCNGRRKSVGTGKGTEKFIFKYHKEEVE